jgi:hypothetical protein
MSTRQDEQPDRPPTERAEELLDRLGQRIEPLSSVAGLYLLRLAARGREVVEDIWAEAQSIHEEHQRNQGKP